MKEKVEVTYCDIHLGRNGEKWEGRRVWVVAVGEGEDLALYSVDACSACIGGTTTLEQLYELVDTWGEISADHMIVDGRPEPSEPEPEEKPKPRSRPKKKKTKTAPKKSRESAKKYREEYDQRRKNGFTPEQAVPVGKDGWQCTADNCQRQYPSRQALIMHQRRTHNMYGGWGRG